MAPPQYGTTALRHRLILTQTAHFFPLVRNFSLIFLEGKLEDFLNKYLNPNCKFGVSVCLCMWGKRRVYVHYWLSERAPHVCTRRQTACSASSEFRCPRSTSDLGQSNSSSFPIQFLSNYSPIVTCTFIIFHTQILILLAEYLFWYVTLCLI
jgi:hypothetical protein